MCFVLCGKICVWDIQDTQSCSVPLSLHLEIEWTKYGSLVNPNAQIVSVKEIIQTNTTSLVSFYKCWQNTCRFLPTKKMHC